MTDLFDPLTRPSLVAMREQLRQSYRFSADALDRAGALFGTEWADRFEEALRRLFPTPEALADAIRGYAAFAMTSLRLQARFERSGEFVSKSYAQAAAEVYHNEAFMQSEYLPGLFLSHYLWPHHYRQIQFFESAFVDPLRVGGATEFLEVGVGTGLYSRFLLQKAPDIRGRGIDISKSSKDFADRQVAAFGFSDRYSVDLEDVTTDTPSASTEACICVEVLEHLEDPVGFLRSLRRVLKPGGKAFVTAAVNAAHTDHIYLYRHASEVEAQAVEAGFAIEQYWVGHAYAPPSSTARVPVAVAFVLG